MEGAVLGRFDPSQVPLGLSLLGVFFAALCALGMLGWCESAPPRTQLDQVSGQITLVDHPHTPRSSIGFLIYIQDERADAYRLYRLSQRELSYDVPRLQTLRLGDRVTALGYHGFLGSQDTYSLWELRRGGELLLSYDQTRRFLSGEAGVMAAMVCFTAVLSVICLSAGLCLRRKVSITLAPR